MNDDERMELVTERFERRLSEESAKTRADVATVRVDVAGLRGEMIDRHGELLKWMMGFLLVGVTAVATLIAVFR
jgi:hypothetical protein